MLGRDTQVVTICYVLLTVLLILNNRSRETQDSVPLNKLNTVSKTRGHPPYFCVINCYQCLRPLEAIVNDTGFSAGSRHHEDRLRLVT